MRLGITDGARLEIPNISRWTLAFAFLRIYRPVFAVCGVNNQTTFFSDTLLFIEGTTGDIEFFVCLFLHAAGPSREPTAPRTGSLGPERG